MLTTVYLAAGCFWGTERYYQKIKGVVNTEVGYANGPALTTDYEAVCAGNGFVEVAQITFDQQELTLPELFATYIRIIDPYSLNQQGNDVGVQYRVGIYSEDTMLLVELERLLEEWETTHGKTTIEIKPLVNYITAEKYHQNYLKRKPYGYCHINLQHIPAQFQKPKSGS